MVLYGLYMVPRRTSAVSHRTYTLWMAIGILAGTAVIGLADRGVPRVRAESYVMVLVSGIIWGTGTSAYTRAVQTIGLSRSTPVKNLSAVFGALLGLVVFREFSLSGAHSTVLVLLGSVAVVVSAWMLSSVEAPEGGTGRLGARRLLVGAALSLWAAIAYSLYTVPMKLMYQQGMSPSGFLFCMGHGCFLGMALPVLLARRGPGAKKTVWRDRGLAVLSGLMWAVGSMCANVAVKIIGVAVTWPLTKTTLVAALYGAFVLREVDLARRRGRFWTGVALSVAGVVALAIALSGRS